MSKLYVFGIGGTGSRVLKSLTMLLASGVDCAFDTIVPVIIDPDESAADLTRTVEAMNKYKEIRDKLEFSKANQNRFFKTELRPVDGMTNFRFPLQNTRDCRFRDYINLGGLRKENQALVNLLFSTANLDSDMKVGFKGNPNIGSVVLNQFADSQQYKDFANGFAQGDRIFIVSSIFGGTGASGFPLLLKTLRNDRNSQGWKLISESRIGAISVLPYFNVSQDDCSGVDSSTFISKTKSALSYYEKNISRNKVGTLDALYYVGDSVAATYDNHDGGTLQKNNAHFVEFCSALSILRFAATPDHEFDAAGGTLHYEYGIDTDDSDIGQIIFKDLGKETKAAVQMPLTQFALVQKYIANECDRQYKHQPWAIDNKLDESFFTAGFYESFKKLLSDFNQWLKEMDENERSFKPFEEDRVNPLFECVNGLPPRKYNIHLFQKNYVLMDSILNKRTPKWNPAMCREQKFMEVFYRATKDLVEHKYYM